MIRKKTFSTNETKEFGEKLARKLHGKEVIALFGEMGIGKTVFTKGLAKGLDIREDINSPTFSLVHEYHGKYPVYHFDMYRVNSWEGLYSTGYYDYLGYGILVIEWSENIVRALPTSAIRVSFSRGENEGERILEIDGMEEV